MASIFGGRFPIVKLTNKLTVVNYGSNHRYIFDTGAKLSYAFQNLYGLPNGILLFCNPSNSSNSPFQLYFGNTG